MTTRHRLLARQSKNRSIRQHLAFVVINVIFVTSTSCATVGVALFYKKTVLPESQIVRNIPYSDSPGASTLNQLDLYLPNNSDNKHWPTMIFVHGGGWSEGDKDLKVGGADVYGNIGRFFASRGIATAIISYRLMPQVDWKTQVMDVAEATKWVYTHISSYHGDPTNIYLAGHSAGAQIVSRVALDPKPLHSLGLSPHLIRGFILISGVGYDFTDESIYQLGVDEGLFLDLFHTKHISQKLRRKISPLVGAKQTPSPFLILYASRDPKEMKESSQNLDKTLTSMRTQSQLYEVPKVSHKSMILALSHPKKIPAIVMMVFMRSSTNSWVNKRLK